MTKKDTNLGAILTKTNDAKLAKNWPRKTWNWSKVGKKLQKFEQELTKYDQKDIIRHKIGQKMYY